jgi:hypothetical protein
VVVERTPFAGVRSVSGQRQKAKAFVYFSVPARLDDARDLTLQRERTEAKTADAELAEERARTATELAAVVLAGLELGLLCVFDALCGRCHDICSLFYLQNQD